eukprot:1492574-Amphidinium_carterae.1
MSVGIRHVAEVSHSATSRGASDSADDPRHLCVRKALVSPRAQLPRSFIAQRPRLVMSCSLRWRCTSGSDHMATGTESLPLNCTSWA